ncbi:MAG: conserved hypothetical protein, secreted [Candidatus Syntrophoarchaeum caldarius]|uniref:Multiheme cytochrome n=1 Tax=Candidatus Syntropharchaeum caldarium TaxID=1838285 RepID=A0A1F2PAA9_9EURY|nr:MAG: conserved hypothetical protein, secreted [Candidatus Syntrophoarchaeum caldarius]
MRRNTTGLLLVAIVAIGIFALPQTAALFSGQHSWYNLSDDGNQLPCVKCHGDINAEMIDSDNGVHKGLASPGCDCHRVNSSQVQKPTGVASGDTSGSTPGTTSHAAETIACMICHEYGNDGLGGYPHAGGFDQPDGVGDYNGDETNDPYQYSYDAGGRNGTKAAHNAFIQQAIDDDLMIDSNEACIGCHTRVGVNISWTKNVVLDFDAEEDEDGEWTVDNFQALGDNVTESGYENAYVESYTYP